MLLSVQKQIVWDIALEHVYSLSKNVVHMCISWLDETYVLC